MDELPLGIRKWDGLSCCAHHDHDRNAALNIRMEGIWILAMGGENPVPASGACVRLPAFLGKRQRAMKLEADTYPLGKCQ